MNRKMKKVKLILAAILTLALLPCFLLGKGSSTSAASKQLQPYEINIVFPGVEQKDIQLVQDKINTITKEKINATVKITTIGFGNWNQQTNLMLASGEKLDLLWTSNFFNYSAIVSKGSLLPLDALLKKYGKNIKSVLAADILNACKIKGKLYGIPSIRDFAANYGFLMRTDILKKYKINVKNIKTAEDMTTVFRIVKEHEPDLVPLVNNPTMTTPEVLGSGIYDKLDNWMGVINLNDRSLKVKNFYETTWYANTLGLLRKWYQAGYLSKDVSTSNYTPESLIKAGKAFSYAYAGKPGIEQQVKNTTGKDLTFVQIAAPVSTTSNITNGMASIPINCKDPDRVMMLLNLWYSNKDLVNTFDNGIEGKHYVKNSQGLLEYPSGVDGSNTGYTSITFRVGNNFLADIWNGNPPDLWTQMDKFNKKAIKSKAMGFTFDSEPVKTEVAAVTNVISQYRMALETGTVDPQTVLPEFISKLKAAGIDKIIAEKQKQLNSWAKEHK